MRTVFIVRNILTFQNIVLRCHKVAVEFLKHEIRCRFLRFPVALQRSPHWSCRSSPFHFPNVTVSRPCRLSEFTLTGPRNNFHEGHNLFNVNMFLMKRRVLFSCNELRGWGFIQYTFTLKKVVIAILLIRALVSGYATCYSYEPVHWNGKLWPFSSPPRPKICLLL